MAPKLAKTENNAIDQVMENITNGKLDEKIRDQLRNDIIDVYTDTRSTIRYNVRKIILESMGFDTSKRGNVFHSTFSRRDTDICNQLSDLTGPLIDELVSDLDSRITAKLKITEDDRDDIASDLAYTYKQAFYKAVDNYKSQIRIKAEKDFEKLMPYILGAAVGTSGDELHAEYIMSIIAGEHTDPKIEIDKDLINTCINTNKDIF